MTTKIATMTRDEVVAEMDELTPRLREVFKSAGTELDMDKVDTLEGTSTEKSVQLTTMNLRLNDLGERLGEHDAALKSQKIINDEEARKARVIGDAPTPTDDAPKDVDPNAGKSFARRFIESKALAEFNGGQGPEVDLKFDIKSLLQPYGVGAKTVMSTGAGWTPESIRAPGSTLAGREERFLTDFIPMIPTTQAAYVFMRQTTRTNNAQEDAESVEGTLDSSAESAFAYTEVTETLRKIRHFLPVTDEQLADVPGLEAELDAEMVSGVLERLASQLISGDGTAPNIEGFLDAGRGSVNSVAKGSDDVFTAIHNGMRTNESTGFAAVDLIVLHPTDWHGIRTTQTADGVFILGPPSVADSKALWGVPVLTTTHETENTALMGGFARFARIPVRGDVTVAISNSHASYFIQGVQAIRAELRATLAVLREDAFTKVTGI